MARYKKYAPLPAGTTILAILGFLISVFWVRGLGPNGPTWAFTFAAFFLILFAASMISMRRANPDYQLKM